MKRVPQMKSVKVESSWVKSVAHIDGNLQLRTLEGRSYLYLKVPKASYERLLRAKSLGQYVNDNIRGKYKCLRLAK